MPLTPIRLPARALRCGEAKRAHRAGRRQGCRGNRPLQDQSGQICLEERYRPPIGQLRAFLIPAVAHFRGEAVIQPGVVVQRHLGVGIQRAVDRVQSNTQGGLAFLATVGSISPFVGLFGTVWGIYHALTAIGISGQASIDKVAGPVGEALIMTAIGLAVAVPAVLAYNWLVRRNKAVMDEVRAFSSDLHAVVLGTVNKA